MRTAVFFGLPRPPRVKPALDFTLDTIAAFTEIPFAFKALTTSLVGTWPFALTNSRIASDLLIFRLAMLRLKN